VSEKYELDALRAIRSMQQTHELADHGPMAERMWAIGDQVEAMQTKIATLKKMLSEAREFIMSGPGQSDEAAIVNKMGRVLEEKS
jgi:hypothetical protein